MTTSSSSSSDEEADENHSKERIQSRLFVADSEPLPSYDYYPRSMSGRRQPMRQEGMIGRVIDRSRDRVDSMSYTSREANTITDTHNDTKMIQKQQPNQSDFSREDSAAVVRIRGGGGPSISESSTTRNSDDMVKMSLSLSAVWEKGNKNWSKDSLRKADTFQQGMTVNQSMISAVRDKAQGIEAPKLSAVDSNNGNNLVAVHLVVAVSWSQRDIKFHRKPYLKTTFAEAVLLCEDLLKTFEDLTRDRNDERGEQDDIAATTRRLGHPLEDAVAGGDPGKQLGAIQGLMDELESQLAKADVWSHDLEDRLNLLRNNVQDKTSLGRQDTKGVTNQLDSLQTRAGDLQSQLSATNKLSDDLEDRLQAFSESGSDSGGVDSNAAASSGKQDQFAAQNVDRAPGSNDTLLGDQLVNLKAKMDNLQSQLDRANQASSNLEHRLNDLNTSIAAKHQSHDDPEASAVATSRSTQVKAKAQPSTPVTATDDFTSAFSVLSSAKPNPKAKSGDSLSIDSSSLNQVSSASTSSGSKLSEPKEAPLPDPTEEDRRVARNPQATAAATSTDENKQDNGIDYIGETDAIHRPFPTNQNDDASDSDETESDMPSLASSISSDSFTKLWANDLPVDFEDDQYTEAPPIETDDKPEKDRADDFTNAFAALSSAKKPQEAEQNANDLESVDSSIMSVPSASYRPEISVLLEEQKEPDSLLQSQQKIRGGGVSPALTQQDQQASTTPKASAAVHGEKRVDDFTAAFSALATPPGKKVTEHDDSDSLDSSMPSISTAVYESEQESGPEVPPEKEDLPQSPKDGSGAKQPTRPITDPQGKALAPKSTTAVPEIDKAPPDEAITTPEKDPSKAVDDFTKVFSALSAPKKAEKKRDTDDDSVDSSIGTIASASTLQDSIARETSVLPTLFESEKPETITSEPPSKEKEKQLAHVSPVPLEKEGTAKKTPQPSTKADEFTSAFAAMNSATPKHTPDDDESGSIDSSVASIDTVSTANKQKVNPVQTAAKKEIVTPSTQPNKKADDFTKAVSALNSPRSQAKKIVDDDSSDIDSSVGSIPTASTQLEDKADDILMQSKAPPPQDSPKADESKAQPTTPVRTRGGENAAAPESKKVNDFTQAFAALNSPKPAAEPNDIGDSIDFSAVAENREEVPSADKPTSEVSASVGGKKVDEFTKIFSALNNVPKQKEVMKDESEIIDSSVSSIPSASFRSDSDIEQGKTTMPVPSAPSAQSKAKAEAGAEVKVKSTQKVDEFTKAISAVDIPGPRPTPGTDNDDDDGIDFEVESVTSMSALTIDKEISSVMSETPRESTKLSRLGDPQKADDFTKAMSALNMPAVKEASDSNSLNIDSTSGSVSSDLQSDQQKQEAHPWTAPKPEVIQGAAKDPKVVDDFTKAFAALNVPQSQAKKEDESDIIDSSAGSVPSASLRSDVDSQQKIFATNHAGKGAQQTDDIATQQKAGNFSTQQKADDFTNAFSVLSSPSPGPETAQDNGSASVDSSMDSDMSAAITEKQSDASQGHSHATSTDISCQVANAFITASGKEGKAFNAHGASLGDKMGALERKLQIELEMVERAEQILEAFSSDDASMEDASMLNSAVYNSGGDDGSVDLSVEDISVESGDSSSSSSVDSAITEDMLLKDLDPPYHEDDASSQLEKTETERKLRQPTKKWPPVATIKPSSEDIATLNPPDDEPTEEAAKQIARSLPPEKGASKTRGALGKRWPPTGVAESEGKEEKATSKKKKWATVNTGVPDSRTQLGQPPPPTGAPSNNQPSQAPTTKTGAVSQLTSKFMAQPKEQPEMEEAGDADLSSSIAALGQDSTEMSSRAELIDALETSVQVKQNRPIAAPREKRQREVSAAPEDPVITPSREADLYAQRVKFDDESLSDELSLESLSDSSSDLYQELASMEEEHEEEIQKDAAKVAHLSLQDDQAEDSSSDANNEAVVMELTSASQGSASDDASASSHVANKEEDISDSEVSESKFNSKDLLAEELPQAASKLIANAEEENNASNTEKDDSSAVSDVEKAPSAASSVVSSDASSFVSSEKAGVSESETGSEGKLLGDDSSVASVKTDRDANMLANPDTTEDNKSIAESLVESLVESSDSTSKGGIGLGLDTSSDDESSSLLDKRKEVEEEKTKLAAGVEKVPLAVALSESSSSEVESSSEAKSSADDSSSSKPKSLLESSTDVDSAIASELQQDRALSFGGGADTGLVDGATDDADYEKMPSNDLDPATSIFNPGDTACNINQQPFVVDSTKMKGLPISAKPADNDYDIMDIETSVQEIAKKTAPFKSANANVHGPTLRDRTVIFGGEQESAAPRNFLDEFTREPMLADPAGFKPDNEEDYKDDNEDSLVSSDSNVSVVSVKSDLTETTGDFDFIEDKHLEEDKAVQQPKDEFGKVFLAVAAATKPTRADEGATVSVVSGQMSLSGSLGLLDSTDSLEKRQVFPQSTAGPPAEEEKMNEDLGRVVPVGHRPTSNKDHPFDEISDFSAGQENCSLAGNQPRPVHSGSAANFPGDAIHLHLPNTAPLEKPALGKLSNVNDAFQRLNRIKDRLRGLRLLMDASEQPLASESATRIQQQLDAIAKPEELSGAMADFSRQQQTDFGAQALPQNDPSDPSPIDEAYGALLRAQSKLRSLRALARERDKKLL